MCTGQRILVAYSVPCNGRASQIATIILRFSYQILFIFALLLSVENQCNAAKTADVVVYGATPGGFCAAIAAAREGAPHR